MSIPNGTDSPLLAQTPHHERVRMLGDITAAYEIFIVTGRTDMRIKQMNMILEATRQAVIRNHAKGENDPYVRTLELGHESDFFSHTIHDYLDSIIRDIRDAHAPTAQPPILSQRLQKLKRSSTRRCSWSTMRNESSINSATSCKFHLIKSPPRTSLHLCGY